MKQNINGLLINNIRSFSSTSLTYPIKPIRFSLIAQPLHPYIWPLYGVFNPPYDSALYSTPIFIGVCLCYLAVFYIDECTEVLGRARNNTA